MNLMSGNDIVMHIEFQRSDNKYRINHRENGVWGTRVRAATLLSFDCAARENPDQRLRCNAIRSHLHDFSFHKSNSS
jgi:hypothetical protein